MTERFALYFSPDTGSELAQFGETILGRTPVSARQSNAFSEFSDQPRWLSLTRQPAHYGFHATLKAPFELNDNLTAEQLLEAVAQFASQRAPLSLKTLAPRRLSHFMALTLAEQTKGITQFAFACVEAFEHFRRPLSQADIQRRLAQALTPRQTQLLQQFGYPHVAEEFRFHMTLSGRIDDQDQDYAEWLTHTFNTLVRAEPVLDQIAVFHQPDRQSAFVQFAEYPLTAAT